MLEVAVKHQYALLVDPQTGQEFNLCRLSTSIGRAISCDIVLSDKSVSRQHAVIFCMQDKFYVEDLSSTNGTTLNRQALTTRVALNSGDELRIGLNPLLFLLIPNRNDTGVYVDQVATVSHEVASEDVKVRRPATTAVAV